METPSFYRNFLHDIIDLMYVIKVKSPEIQKYTKKTRLKNLNNYGFCKNEHKITNKNTLTMFL